MKYRVYELLNSIMQHLRGSDDNESDPLKLYTGIDDMDVSDGESNRPGLWDNIRKKKERMGKHYRPAKPGDKGRPDSDQWKKLTKG